MDAITTERQATIIATAPNNHAFKVNGQTSLIISSVEVEHFGIAPKHGRQVQPPSTVVKLATDGTLIETMTALDVSDRRN